MVFLTLRSKSKQLENPGQTVPDSGDFPIVDEPIIFGMPIVLNPLFFVPRIAAQTLNGVITYVVMDTWDW